MSKREAVPSLKKRELEEIDDDDDQYDNENVLNAAATSAARPTVAQPTRATPFMLTGQLLLATIRVLISYESRARFYFNAENPQLKTRLTAEFIEDLKVTTEYSAYLAKNPNVKLIPKTIQDVVQDSILLPMKGMKRLIDSVNSTISEELKELGVATPAEADLRAEVKKRCLALALEDPESNIGSITRHTRTKKADKKNPEKILQMTKEFLELIYNLLVDVQLVGGTAEGIYGEAVATGISPTDIEITKLAMGGKSRKISKAKFEDSSPSAVPPGLPVNVASPAPGTMQLLLNQFAESRDRATNRTKETELARAANYLADPNRFTSAATFEEFEKFREKEIGPPADFEDIRRLAPEIKSWIASLLKPTSKATFTKAFVEQK